MPPSRHSSIAVGVGSRSASFGRAFHALLIVAALAVGASAAFAARAEAPPIPAMFTEARGFLDAIEKERAKGAPSIAVTGISVPHNLLAADFPARGFWV